MKIDPMHQQLLNRVNSREYHQLLRECQLEERYQRQLELLQQFYNFSKKKVCYQYLFKLSFLPSSIGSRRWIRSSNNHLNLQRSEKEQCILIRINNESFNSSYYTIKQLSTRISSSLLFFFFSLFFTSYLYNNLPLTNDNVLFIVHKKMIYHNTIIYLFFSLFFSLSLSLIIIIIIIITFTDQLPFQIAFRLSSLFYLVTDLSFCFFFSFILSSLSF